MTKKTRILISVLSALLASFCFFAYVQSVRADAEKSRAEAIQKYGGELTSILVATKQIEPGETLSSSNTQVKSWISDLIPEGAITNPESVMGRTVSSVIGVGMPVVSLHLRSVASQISIPENLVGLTISHGEKYGLAERLSAGTKLAAYEVTDSLITCIASDIAVLSDDTEGTLYTSSSVTLGLTPEQVPAVLSAYAREHSALLFLGQRLTLRTYCTTILTLKKKTQKIYLTRQINQAHHLQVKMCSQRTLLLQQPTKTAIVRHRQIRLLIQEVKRDVRKVDLIRRS